MFLKSSLNLSIIINLIMISSCSENEDNSYYTEWTTVGEGLDEDITKNVLTEFVGSTNCPYCPAEDAKLLSYFDSNNENYVGTDITSRWYLINYHTYSPSGGDPMYEFLRGTSETGEDDYCYIRFEEGNWYTLYGVPTTYTNGSLSSVNPEMAIGPMSESTPLSISLDRSSIDGSSIEVKIYIKSSKNMMDSDSVHLFIAATLDHVSYTGYNGEPHHQDVFVGWITEGLGGEMISIGKEEIVKNYNWEMPSNWPQNNFETTWHTVEWDESNLAIVAFIQNKYTKEVLQVSGYK